MLNMLKRILIQIVARQIGIFSTIGKSGDISHVVIEKNLQENRITVSKRELENFDKPY